MRCACVQRTCGKKERKEGRKIERKNKKHVFSFRCVEILRVYQSVYSGGRVRTVTAALEWRGGDDYDGTSRYRRHWSVVSPILAVSVPPSLSHSLSLYHYFSFSVSISFFHTRVRDYVFYYYYFPSSGPSDYYYYNILL